MQSIIYDEFSCCEFEEIARGINGVWSKRLSENIYFPKETYELDKCKDNLL